ncbi:MAG: fatty acid desaturase family protein [Hyphomicrobiales bacterium]
MNQSAASRTDARIVFPTVHPHRFAAAVKERVAEYFQTRNLSSKANASMVLRTVVVLTVTFGAYALILSNRFGPWTMLGLAVVMGIGVAGIGFGVAHDALHEAYSTHPRVNRLLGLTFDLIGASSYMWRLTHNVIHHTYTNVHGVDEDLEVSPLLRLSPGTPHRPIHRFQHWYAFFTYALSTLNWVFIKDYQYFLRRDLGPYRNRIHPASAIAGLIVGKTVYYGYTLVVPLLVLHVAWWQVLVGFVAMHLTAGVILGVVFQLAHVVEETDHPEAGADGRMASVWAVHQMETTSDFAQGNRFLTWYVGGLNHQVEHHLFPRVCSTHYPAIAAIVRATAAEHGVPYHAHRTLADAIRSHFLTLKRLGAGAATVPAVAEPAR